MIDLIVIAFEKIWHYILMYAKTIPPELTKVLISKETFYWLTSTIAQVFVAIAMIVFGYFGLLINRRREEQQNIVQKLTIYEKTCKIGITVTQEYKKLAHSLGRALDLVDIVKHGDSNTLSETIKSVVEKTNNMPDRKTRLEELLFFSQLQTRYNVNTEKIKRLRSTSTKLTAASLNIVLTSLALLLLTDVLYLNTKYLYISSTFLLWASMLLSLFLYLSALIGFLRARVRFKKYKLSSIVFDNIRQLDEDPPKEPTDD